MRIVRENINEKFTEESDPIADMGIGTMGFGNIKRGDTIKVKKDFYNADTPSNLKKMYFSPSDTLGKNFLPWAKEDIKGVVVKSKKHSKSLELYIAFFGDNEFFNYCKKEIKKGYNLEKNYLGLAILYSDEKYSTWAEYFKIIEKT